MTFLASLLSEFYTNFIPNTLKSIIANSPADEELTDDAIMKEFYYSLYKQYGIRRNIINDSAVLFNYKKLHNNYNRDDKLTHLFRSAVINPRAMAFTSLGVPRSIKFEESKLMEDFNNCRFESFDYGTMIIYNNGRTYTYMQHNVEDNTDEQITVDASIATRSKIDASGNYNTEVSHRYYFELNNREVEHLDFTKLPIELRDATFVFNMRNKMEHVGGVDSNTLVAVYKMPSNIDDLISNWSAIMQHVKQKDISNIDALCSKHLALGEIEVLSIADVAIKMDAAGVGSPRLPTSLSFKNVSELEAHIEKLAYYEAGVMVWLPDGSRTKVRNPHFSYVRGLCYNQPINPSPLNQKNLFKIFWRLQLEDKVPEFLKYYETPDNRYNFIFRYFQSRVHQFTQLLFKTYQAVHVRKSMTIATVYKFLKPVCFDLHKQYLDTKEPITIQKTVDFIKGMEFPALYGRLFTPIM